MNGQPHPIRRNQICPLPSEPTPPLIKINAAPAGAFGTPGNPLNTLDVSSSETASHRPPSVMGKARSPRLCVIRKDRHGKYIDKMTKKHHITFRDNILGVNVADVQEVESYKKYNLVIEAPAASCACVLL